MYNQFRLEMLREMVSAGINEEALKDVLGILDKMSASYDMNRKETAIVPYSTLLHKTLMEFLACKSVEGLSQLTLKGYHYCLTTFLRWLRKPLGEVEANDLRLYLYQYQQGHHVSNRTLDRVRTNLNVFFQWMVNEHKIESNPCTGIHPIKYTAKPKTALSQLELEYIRRACGSKREKAIVELLYSTGCRVSELTGMRLGDINWEEKTVSVFGKGGKYRTCFLNAKAYVALEDYLKTRTDSNDHVIVSERQPHNPLTRFAVEQIIRGISDRAFRMTGKHVTPHIFRHTTATTALQNGMPVERVSRMLGHSLIETTMVYAEVNNADVHRDHVRYVV